ncbi:MAG: alpha-galactosidase [Clostridia bacterium]|nr:alpha-galactosidase [Clostridia bacterium]
MKIYAKQYEKEKRSKGTFGNIGSPVCSMKIEESNGVTLVYANVVTQSSLDPDFGVGIDIPFKGRYMADFRSSQFWCQPAFGSDPSKIPDQTQYLLYEKEDGSFGVILPVVSDTYRCVLVGKNESTLTAKLYSGYRKLCSCQALAFVTAEGSDPHELTEKCVTEALKALGSGIPHRKDRRYPETFEYLGWCSWDAMQIRVNHDGLLEKCREFKDKGIPVRWVLFDDMWANVRDFHGHTYNSFSDMCRLMHSSALYDYEADPIRFPSGLAKCIEDIKKQGFMAGIWYPITGYWRGIEKDSPAFDKLKNYLIETDDGIFVPDFLREKSFGYFHTINSFLKKCGADFIKIDNQSAYTRFYNDLAPIGEAARSYHDGMEAAAGAVFDNAMINCMGMSSEDMWNRSASAISRCSNDFQPENRPWFASHMLQCAYNSMIQGQFYWCDWDMWWTDDGQALKNSLARAVSGGPIYVSDQIGRSHARILEPLALSNGKILRCDRPATPTADCLCSDPTASGKPMKIQNICNGSGVMVLYNLDAQNNTVSGEISPSQIPELEGEEFAVYSHFDKTVKILKRNEKLSITLTDNDDLALYVFLPYENGFAAIGRTDKFISPATVASVHDEKIILKEDGPYAFVKDGKLVFSE